MRLLLIASLATVCVAFLSAQPPAAVTIANVTIIDGTGSPGRLGDVSVRGGQIVAVSRAGSKPAGEVIDGTGRYLVPGLWDMHVHLATRPEPELAEKMILPLLLAHGIVGVRDMGGPLDRVLSLRDQVAGGTLIGPRILTPGPFVDGPGEEDPVFRRPANAAAAAPTVKALVDRRVDFVKAQAGLAPDVHAALAKAARDAGVPLVGHIPMAMSVEQVIGSGQRSLEHLSPALAGDGMLLLACSSKATELLAELRAIESERAKIGAAAAAQREAALREQAVKTYDPQKARALGAAMRTREVWITPTLIWSASLRPLTREHDGRDLPMEFVPAALRTRWTDRRRQFIERQTPESFAANAALAATAGRAVRDLQAGGASVLAGTDTFDAFVLPGHSLHQELKALVDAGFSPLEALQAATRTAAEYRGTAKTEGTIAAGKRADLVLLDADPSRDIGNAAKVHAVFVAGRRYDRAALDRMLEDVKAFAK